MIFARRATNADRSRAKKSVKAILLLPHGTVRSDHAKAITNASADQRQPQSLKRLFSLRADRAFSTLLSQGRLTRTLWNEGRLSHETSSPAYSRSLLLRRKSFIWTHRRIQRALETECVPRHPYKPLFHLREKLLMLFVASAAVNFKGDVAPAGPLLAVSFCPQKQPARFPRLCGSTRAVSPRSSEQADHCGQLVHQ